MNNNKIDLYCFVDGACAPINPKGHIGIGGLIKDSNMKTIYEFAGYEPENKNNSNNVAEYMALNFLLEKLLNDGYENESILIHTDSDLMANQMNGRWRIKDGMYREQALRAVELLSNFTNVKIKWIRREFNKEADALSNVEFEKRGIKKFVAKK